MTLGVKIIDKLTNQVLNKSEDEILFGILMDDTINVIKQKMFVALGIMYYPNLIKLETKINNEYVLLDDNNCLLFCYEKYPDEPVIYVTNLFAIINENSYKDLNFEPYYLYTTVVKQSNDILEDYFNILLKEFTELTIDDLNNIMKMKIKDFSDQNSNYTLFSVSDLDFFNTDIVNYIELLNSEHRKVFEIYKNEKYLIDFYKKAYELKDYSLFYETNVDKSPLFTYISIIYTIKKKGIELDLDSGDTTPNKMLKLDKIFNMLELSEKIPFVVYSGTGDNKTPKVKIYNKIISDISDNVIKSWVLNEKKKMNQMTYKKIKGLMIKYKLDVLKTKKIENLFMTIILNEDGEMIVKLNFTQDDDKTFIEDITEMVKIGIDDIIDTINQLDNVYYNSNRLPYTKELDVSINSINVVLATNMLINKNKLRNMLTKFGISDIFELKESKDETKLSMYYKNYGKRDSEDMIADKKGITVTVQNNDFKMNSSIISIYSGYSINQIITIVNEISILSLLAQEGQKSISILDEEIEEQKEIKEKSNIKKLKESIKTSSTKCQKQKQPKELEGTETNEFLEINKKSIIKYENRMFICPNPQYPYPGFTSDNILCCFKKEGRRLKQMMEKPYVLETIVQPSNFIINVKNISEQDSFETYVIKVISDINEEFGIINTIDASPYFYISNNSLKGKDLPLVHIHNKDLIQLIEETENNAPSGYSMWLNSVPLSQLLTKPNKSTCVHQPNLELGGTKNLNAPCQHHADNNIFGYNINSYPCCFDNKRNIYNLVKIKEKNPIKMHILTTDKPAAKQHLGHLQKGLKELFELINTNTKSQFYRWGVNQNNLAFFNCILEGIEYKIGNNSIENTTELRRLLINYLEQNPDDFYKLNSGNIVLKYNSLPNYIDAIRDNVNVIYWMDIIDLVKRALGINILVIDIPYTDPNTIDYNNTKLICNFSMKYDITKPFMIFIKKKKTFEIIVEIEEKPLSIRFAFDYKTSIIIKFFLKYYKTTCIKQDVYPDTYTYQSALDINDIIELLKGTPHEFLCQLVNVFNKVNMIVTKTGLIIPVKESGILNMPFVWFNDFIKKDKSIDIIKYKKELESLNVILPIDKQITILGITTKSINNIKYYTGILTNYGQIIPVKNTQVDDTILQDLELDFKYYPDVDTYLYNKDYNKDLIKNLEVEWNQQVSNKNNDIYEIKKVLGKKLSDSDKTKIVTIIKKPKLSKINKIEQIKNIFKTYININTNQTTSIDFILDHIANEVINDNIQNSLLNNLITSDVYNPNEIVKRDNESILLNINDIRKWISKFSINE